MLTGQRVVCVSKATPTFDARTGEPAEDSYGNKAHLDFNGDPLFAEFVILRHLEAAGWERLQVPRG